MRRWPTLCCGNTRRNWDRLHASPEAMEERAEAYVLHHMPPAEIAAYEKHLLICDPCREAVAVTEVFVEMLLLAAESLDPLPVEVALR